jgi:hypothetical protein
METVNKKYSAIKEKIKVLSKEQRVLKNQRKTIHLVGERTIEPWAAYFQHQANRSELKDLYITYRLLKGVPIEEIQAQYKTPINMNKVNQLVEEYGKTLYPGK